MKNSHIVLVVVAALIAIPALAGDWPQFKRDANRSGDASDEAFAFPLERIAAVRFPAAIYASPAVVGGLVYIQDARGHVACVDAAKNEVRWTSSIGGINNSSSPAVAAGKVFIGSTAGHLAILDARNGEVLAKVPAEGGVLTAPAVTSDAVYFSTFNGKLSKCDLDGKVIWTYDGGRISTTEFTLRGKEILFFAGNDNTFIHHLRDLGDKVETIAKIAAPGQCCPVSGPAFITDDTFTFQSFDSEFGRFHLMSLKTPPPKNLPTAQDVNDTRAVATVRGSLIYRGDKCFAAAGLKQVWRADSSVLYDGSSHSSPALGKDVLAVGNEMGAVTFLPLESKDTIRKPLWQFKTIGAGQPNGAVSSSLALADGKVFFGGEDGILYGLGKGTQAAVVDLPPVKENKVVRTRLKGSEWPTPGGDMGFSYVSDDKVVNPPFELGWKTRLWSGIKGPMIVADSMVFYSGRLGPVTALDAATGEILWKIHHPGVESRPSGTYADGKFVIMRVKAGQGDSPFVGGVSLGPPGEGVWCHDAVTGKLLWHQPMTLRYHFNPDGLAIHNGKVFVAQLDKEGKLEALAFDLNTGKEVWRQSLADFSEKIPAKSNADVKDPPKGLRLPPRFSGVIAGGLWCVSLSNHGTAGLDPDTGKVAWTTADVFITYRTRVASRNDVLVVFTPTGDRALDAKTGKPLWRNDNKNSYAQPLTDLFLESQGKKDVHVSGRCWWPIFANGVWYSHSQSSSNNKLVALKEKIVWSHDFMSNACPSPSPAYGRLYYAPNGEGVVYSFVNAGKSPNPK